MLGRTMTTIPYSRLYRIAVIVRSNKTTQRSGQRIVMRSDVDLPRKLIRVRTDLAQFTALCQARPTAAIVMHAPSRVVTSLGSNPQPDCKAGLLERTMTTIPYSRLYWIVVIVRSNSSCRLLSCWRCRRYPYWLHAACSFRETSFLPSCLWQYF